jgi:antitoxin MazE
VKTSIVQIGNSRGVRIPKLLLEQAGLSGEVELQARGKEIVIRAVSHVRQGWQERFQQMAEQGEDQLLSPDLTGLSDWDREEWQW